MYLLCVYFSHTVGPIIIMGPESVNVSIDTENITLNCTVIGVPIPDITWTHNDGVLNSDDMFSDEIFINIFDEIVGTRLSVLTIVSPQSNNIGDYSCNATSPVEFYESVMSEVVTVLVQGMYVSVCVLCVCIYVCLHTCMCVYMSAYVCVYVCIYLCVSAYVCGCAYLNMCVLYMSSHLKLLTQGEYYILKLEVIAMK